VIALLYDLHGNMVNEIDTLLAEYTDHDSVMERRSLMNREAQGSKSQFSIYTYMDGVEVDVDSLEPSSSPTNPNQTPILSTENKLNANGWEIPKPETPIEPTGWGTNDEETIHDEYMDGEESTELYLICCEAMENEVNASHIKIEVEKMSPIMCKDGCPIYPIWDNDDDENMYELDNSGGLNILRMEEKFDGVTEAYQYLDGYFSMTDITLEPSSEPDYTLSVEVVLPGTLRHFACFNGWTPGMYFEGED
jgi:hypothetical protein